MFRRKILPHIVNHDGRVKQAWNFPHAPAADGFAAIFETNPRHAPPRRRPALFNLSTQAILCCLALEGGDNCRISLRSGYGLDGFVGLFGREFGQGRPLDPNLRFSGADDRAAGMASQFAPPDFAQRLR